MLSPWLDVKSDGCECKLDTRNDSQAERTGMAVQVDADNQSWDSSSPAGHADGCKASTARRPWWQGSYSLRIWGPEFLAVGRGESDDDPHQALQPP